MSWRLAMTTLSGMDTLGLLILAIGSLAFLDIAALNLRGNERSKRRARATRDRR
jgi:hypothetical protein